MNKEKINYQNKLDEIISDLSYKPSLLLHSCCGPCSSYVIMYLKDYFNITVYYYNPNIEPLDEYNKRKQEQIRLIKELALDNVTFLDCEYNNVEYKELVKDLNNEPEGGIRCHKCYEMRLAKTGNVAKDNNFEYFGTTLSVSPYKNAQIINQIGERLSYELEVKWLYSDFKKKEGYKKSIELSKQYDLYRQDYCGCLASKNHE